VACRERRPAHYLAVVASLLPKQLSIDDVWMKNPDEITREEPEAERPKVRGGAAPLGKISPALLGIISPVQGQSLAHDLEPVSMD
jgi:hypothetical protein